MNVTNFESMSQQALLKNIKVLVDFNPYLYTDTQVEIKEVEQIKFYHKKIKGTSTIGEFLKNKKYSKWRRKRVTKDILKIWEKEFKDKMEEQKKQIKEKTKKEQRKKIKRISSLFIFLGAFISAIAIILVSKLSFMEKAPFIDGFVKNFNIMINEVGNHNLVIGLVYLSLITCLYLIVIKTYLDESRRLGVNSEKFIDDEFLKILTNFHVQHKAIKKHLFRVIRLSFYKQKYKIKKIFDYQAIIQKLDDYGKYVAMKVSVLRKYYYWFLFLGFILELGLIALTGYIGYIYYNDFIKIG